MFFSPADRKLYLTWLADYADKYDLEIWAYCLMTNHVHLLVVGHQPDSLAQAIGRTHGRYAQWQNKRRRWSGHFWASRFYSTPLDERHLWAAIKYVELNPVRSGIVENAENYDWSSARSHATGLVDPLLSSKRPFPGSVSNWSEWLKTGIEEESLERLRRNTSTGRPTGSDAFVAQLETHLGRILQKKKRGRKPTAVTEVGRMR